ncbi:hypothetical protein KAU45_00840 [bacterium]|nr:hypothetical protein [bacterium]
MSNKLLILSLIPLTLLTFCREESRLSFYPIAPDGDLADRVATPELAPGDHVTTGGLVNDTGALTSLTSYDWGPGGITREVYFLEPRRPDLEGSLVLVTDAEVVETGVYGYGIRLTGGVAEPDPVPVPAVKAPEEYLERLDRLDLDALSAHPEHNGNFHPARMDIEALTWRAVDWVGGPNTRRWLLQASRLPLPPFADPRLERWLQIFATVDGCGRMLQVWVGIRGSFLE